MEIATSYRKARRNTSIFCGISIAWSAAQFDLKLLNMGALGKVDISGASIPAIFACAIIYTMVRCTIEFMMQPNEIRRWNLAQIDYKITLNLVRISLLSIAATTAFRSIETVLVVSVAALALFFIFFVLVGILLFVIIPLKKHIRIRQGRILTAGAIGTAVNLAILIVGILYILFFITLSFPAIKHLPFFDYFPPIQNQTAAIVFAITAIIITVSFFYERIMTDKIFAFEPKTIVVETKLPNGTIGVEFKDNPNHPDYVASSSETETEIKK